MTTTLIPGIYTDYNITGVRYAGAYSAAGLITVNNDAESGAYSITSVAEASQIFGDDADETKLCSVMFLNGVKVVKAAVASTYAAACALILEQNDVTCFVMTNATAQNLTAVKTALTGAGENGKYRVCFADIEGTAQAMCTLAEGVDHEQFCLCAGAFGGAAAICAMSASQADPAIPFSGAKIAGASCEENFTDSQLELLLSSGVTPLCRIGGETEIVRAVTANSSDLVWRELNTILIVCDVIPDMKSVLKAMFTRAKNTAATRGAVRTQVMIELDRKKDAGIIDDYGNVTVTQNANDPTVCDVGFEFTAAAGMQQLILSAYITV